MDGNESMEISMANWTDGNGIRQNFQRPPLFFRFLRSCLVAVLVESREISQGQGVWREWHFGISIVHYVQARGP